MLHFYTQYIELVNIISKTGTKLWNRSMDVSLLSFGQQNQWQYLSNLSKQKGGGGGTNEYTL